MRAKDSIGAKVSVVATNVPVGLGEPIFDRLDAEIAHGLMSINAVKGVEIGDGFEVVNQKGSEHRDELTPEGFPSNHAGGVLGGISSGQQIIAPRVLVLVVKRLTYLVSLLILLLEVGMILVSVFVLYLLLKRCWH